MAADAGADRPSAKIRSPAWKVYANRRSRRVAMVSVGDVDVPWDVVSRAPVALG